MTEVLLTLLLLAATIAAHASTESAQPRTNTMGPEFAWVVAPTALGALPDATRLEAVFATQGLDSQRGTVVTAERDAKGTPNRKVAVRRQNLGSGHVEQWENRRPAQECAAIAGAWSVGDVRVQNLEAGLREGPVAPQVVLVEGVSDVGSLVTLAPGDTVEQRRVTVEGTVVDRRLIVRHRDSSLELRLDGERSWVCAGKI